MTARQIRVYLRGRPLTRSRNIRWIHFWVLITNTGLTAVDERES
jgi:hypothetical protein